MKRETHPWLWTLLLALAIALPLALHAQGQDFYISMISRMMIYGIAACSLNLILGFGGSVEFIGIISASLKVVNMPSLPSLPS